MNARPPLRARQGLSRMRMLAPEVRLLPGPAGWCWSALLVHAQLGRVWVELDAAPPPRVPRLARLRCVHRGRIGRATVALDGGPCRDEASTWRRLDAVLQRLDERAWTWRELS